MIPHTEISETCQQQTDEDGWRRPPFRPWIFIILCAVIGYLIYRLLFE